MFSNWWDSNNAVEFMEKTQIFSTMLEREDCRTLIQDLHGPLIEYCSRDDWLLSKIDMTLDEVNHQKLQKGKTKTVPNPPILVRLKDRSFLSMIVTTAPNRQSDEYLIQGRSSLDDALQMSFLKFESGIRRNSGLIVSKGGKQLILTRQCGFTVNTHRSG